MEHEPQWIGILSARRGFRWTRGPNGEVSDLEFDVRKTRTDELPTAHMRLSIAEKVAVWSGRATGHLVPDDIDILSPEERQRFSAFRDPVRAANFATAHAEVRRCLAQVLDLDPGAIRFGRHPCAGCGQSVHGRPYIQHPHTDWEFSLSRSGPYWLCAAAAGMRVGVDLECVRRTDFGSLASVVLSESERTYFQGVPAGRRDAEFIRCWTRKEAVVKASGIGVEATLGNIDVGPGRRAAVVSHSAAGCEVDTWLVTDLPTGSDYFSALAVPAFEEFTFFLGEKSSVHPIG
ncbi:4'-phosphopantetheinyl transferase superfamily protein [Streptomyces sp. NBC_00564]|uniref:4'-phosphopantetheinyl transferase family protein n=1 Tax=Streptomyces sp. NBC_00564 TaxID=2903663 RepID=UPI00352BDFC9|nr:4'-phosphopantetheinyl transferase superfamily protein [Streptomyces sp. NBC_00564]